MRFKEFNKLTEMETADAISKIFGMVNSMGIPNDTNIDNIISTTKTDIASPAASNSKGSVNSDTVSSYLKSLMDDNHRLGILANIQAESGFNPGIMGDKNTSGGLFQHHNERFTNMVNAVGSDWATDWKGQIDFALSEPAGKKYLSINFSSPAQATKWWTLNFEIPAQANLRAAERVGMLKNFA